MCCGPSMDYCLSVENHLFKLYLSIGLKGESLKRLLCSAKNSIRCCVKMQISEYHERVVPLFEVVLLKSVLFKSLVKSHRSTFYAKLELVCEDSDLINNQN